MRVCPHCGKTNRPERKFCIRCGKSLLARTRKTRKKVQAEVPETGTVTTAATLAKREKEKTKVQEEELSVTTEDRWVRPSQIPKDRIVKTTKKMYRSELEKAKEAFARAEEVGLDEEGEGIIETRLLRASEVKDLLEEAEAITDSEAAEPSVPPETPVSKPAEAPVTEPAQSISESAEPPKREEVVDESEVKILGSMSAFLGQTPSSGVETPAPEMTPAAAELSEFKSALYESREEPVEMELPVAPTAAEKPVESPAIEPATTKETLEEPVKTDTVAICPKCGTPVSADGFTYPSEVYREMGNARLKQARFFVVQGKYLEAKRVMAIARGLFLQADDNKGLKQVDRLETSINKAKT